jgi:16S rRNA pseudouridine516 synthase
MAKMRLDKFLVEMGQGSRSQIKQEAKKGLIQVNGQVIKETDYKIDPETDQVIYGGSFIGYAAYEYYLLNKPAGYLSATEDKREKTVLDLIPDRLRQDLFPVGRLDKDTEGLLLITNDGELAHRLLHPKKHVDKTYYAEVTGSITREMIEQFAAGLDIGDDTLTLPAVLREVPFLSGEGRENPHEAGDSEKLSAVEITIREGRFHQIKRMFEAVGSKVCYLKRLTMGPLSLDPALKLGEYRPLTEEEKHALGVPFR